MSILAARFSSFRCFLPSEGQLPAGPAEAGQKAAPPVLLSDRGALSLRHIQFTLMSSSPSTAYIPPFFVPSGGEARSYITT